MATKFSKTQGGAAISKKLLKPKALNKIIKSAKKDGRSVKSAAHKKKISDALKKHHANKKKLIKVNGKKPAAKISVKKPDHKTKLNTLYGKVDKIRTEINKINRKRKADRDPIALRKLESEFRKATSIVRAYTGKHRLK